MSISMCCPTCGAAHTLADSLEGKTVRCRRCEQTFTVQLARTKSKDTADDDEGLRTEPAPLQSRARREEDDRPRRRRSYDEEEDDRYRRRRGGEDEDDQPRRRAVGQSGGATVWIVLGGIAATLLLLCGGAGAVVYFAISQAVENEQAQAQSRPRPGDANGGNPAPGVGGGGGPARGGVPGGGPAPAGGAQGAGPGGGRRPGPNVPPDPDRKPAGGVGEGQGAGGGVGGGASMIGPPDPKPGTGLGIATPAEVVGDIRVTHLTLGTGPGPSCLCWARDGKAFYHLDGKGTVRRVSFPNFKEEASLETGKKCGWLSVSAEGVVLTVNEAQEMWLLDARSLKVASRVGVGKAKRVASSPALSYAYATGSEVASATLSVIDLKAGKMVKLYGNRDFIKEGVNFDYPVVSADGKRLFTTDGYAQMYRFTLEGAAVTFGEASPRIISGRFEGLCVSPDGKFVCAPSGAGNGATEGEQEPPLYTTAIFAADGLKKALLRLKSGAYPLAVGFDTKSGFLYAQNFRKELIVFDSEGVKLKEHILNHAGDSGSTRQFLVHPDGLKLLVLGEGGDAARPAQLWYVELPAK
jgi:hypothetical protein